MDASECFRPLLALGTPPWSHAHAHCYSWLTPLPSNSEPLSSGNLLAPAGRLPFLGFGHIPVGYLVTLLAESVHILTLLSGFLLFSLLAAL